MATEVQLDKAREGVLHAENRVLSCRDIIKEVERQGRYHLRGTARDMLAEAEQLLLVHQNALAILLGTRDHDSTFC